MRTGARGARSNCMMGMHDLDGLRNYRNLFALHIVLAHSHFIDFIATDALHLMRDAAREIFESVIPHS
jgi:hypothetical protein